MNIRYVQNGHIFNCLASIGRLSASHCCHYWEPRFDPSRECNFYSRETVLHWRLVKKLISCKDFYNLVVTLHFREVMKCFLVIIRFFVNNSHKPAADPSATCWPWSPLLTLQPLADHRATCWPFSLKPSSNHLLSNRQQLTLQPASEPQPLADQAASIIVLTHQPTADPSVTCWFSSLPRIFQPVGHRPFIFYTTVSSWLFSQHPSSNYLLTKQPAAGWPFTQQQNIQQPLADPPALSWTSSC
jgi:hypothetical protein